MNLLLAQSFRNWLAPGDSGKNVIRMSSKIILWQLARSAQVPFFDIVALIKTGVRQFVSYSVFLIGCTCVTPKLEI